MAPHRAIGRLALNNGYADFRPTDRVAFASNPAFDASTMEVWATLINGGSVVVVDQATLLDPQRFKRWLEDHAISVLWLTAGLFHQYADALAQPFARLRILITGGDVVDPRVAARVLERSPPQRLLNGYGPTETTTFAATCQIREVAASATSIPIGRPISNARIYILDRHCEPVPIGAAGEIHIGGAGVARGYLNRPELTAERFIASPFVDGDRLYRTGDLGRYRRDGTIEFLGRNDFQVKIRGFRIEPGEIEARLAEHPGVREAVVLAREDAPGDKRLVAYTTTRPDAAPPGAEALRAHLAASLPEYMVPAAYVALDALPLTANGKLDRQALPAPDSSAFAARGYEPPVGETEERLALIWAEVLKLERVGRRDNFFELGGHSLLAIRLLSRTGAIFNTNLPLSTVFHSPTIAALAEVLQNQSAPSKWFSLVPIRREGSRPPLFCIEVIGVEFFELMGADQPIYNLRFGVGSPSGSILRLPMIEALAAHYIEELRAVQPSGPYFLIGYSWGGLVAYEMAQQLTASGEAVELVALVDTLLPVALKHSFGDRAVRIISYPPSKFFEKLKYKVKTRLTRKSLRYNAQLTLRKWRYGSTYYRPDFFDVETVYTVMRAYRPSRYSGKVIFFKAAENSVLPYGFHQSSEMEWKRLVGRGLEIEQVLLRSRNDHEGSIRRADRSQDQSRHGQGDKARPADKRRSSRTRGTFSRRCYIFIDRPADEPNAMRPSLPGRKRAHEFADSLCRFQTSASQHKHGRLTGLNDAAFQQSGERGGGDGGGRLHIEADPAQFEQSFFDLNFRNCDGRAAGTPHGGQDFAGPHRLRDRRAVRDCRTDLNWHKIAGPGLEACVKRRAILRLRSEQPGPICDLAAA